MQAAPAGSVVRPPEGLARGAWEARPVTVWALAALVLAMAVAWAALRLRRPRP